MDTQLGREYDNGRGSRSMENGAERSGKGADGRAEEGTLVQDPEELNEVPLDLVFGILKNSRRRRVIRYLRQQGGQVSVSDLAEHIAAIENDTKPAMLSSKQRKRVYVGLYQCHLPRMDDAGVIEYNKDRGTIERGDNASVFETHLESALGLNAGGGSNGNGEDRPARERTDEKRNGDRQNSVRIRDTIRVESGTTEERGSEPGRPNRSGYLALVTVIGMLRFVIRQLFPGRRENGSAEPNDQSDGETGRHSTRRRSAGRRYR